MKFLTLIKLLRGWDQSSIVAANLSWPKVFHLSKPNGEWNSSVDEWIFGAVNEVSGPMFNYIDEGEANRLTR